MQLHTIWFIIIAVFWIGFFVLEGFDFGVGALHRLIGKTETERRVAINTIGPWWDGNEVWLIVAGAAHVRGLPRLVRDDVLGAVPRAGARARGAVRARRRRSSTAASATDAALAERVVVGADDRQRR